VLKMGRFFCVRSCSGDEIFINCYAMLVMSKLNFEKK